MKKGLKIAGIVLGVAILVFVALLVLAQVLITPERVRTTVLPMARDALNGREVQLGDIQVSFFSGIRLGDLKIGERDSDESFVTADQVVLRYQLLPLLAKRVVIDEIRLLEPLIRVERLEDGRFNFSDLLEGKGDGEGEAGETGGGGPPIDLLVSEIVVADGEVIFLDHAVGTDPPYRTKITALQVNASDISLDDSFPLTLKAMINQAELGIEARIDPAVPGGSAEIRLADFDVTAFAPYFREQIPGELNALRVDLDLTAEGSAESARSQGEIVLREIELLPPEGDESLQVDLVRLDFKLAADLGRDRLEIDDTVLNLNGIPLQVTGQIEKVTTGPRIDLVLAIAELELHDAVQAIPASLRQPAIDLEPSGAVELRLHLAGPLDGELAGLLKEGEIGLREVTVTVGPARPALSGLLQLAGDTVHSKNLVLRAGENRADIDLRVKDLLGETIVVSSALTSDRFQLDALLGAAAPMAGQEQTEESADQSPSEEIGPIDLPLKVEGTVRIGETVYRGLSMTDFFLRYRLVENIFTVEELRGHLAEGSFNQTARVDLGVKGLAYRGRIAVDGVKAHPFVSAFLPAATGTVFGTLNLEGSFSGQGTVPENIKKSLSGQGDFSLVDGKLTGAGLVEKLAGYLDLEELRVMQISKAEGNFALERGKMKIDGNFSGSDVRMAPKGTIGLEGRLDLALNARLSPQLADRLGGDLEKLLSGQEGWTLLPLKVDGTWSAPRFNLDTSALKRQATEKAKQELQQKLREKVLDKVAPPEEGSEETGEPGRKLLDDALRGLFGN